MTEKEKSPIVINKKAPNDLQIGDYVFASRWSDCDPADPWCVGRITEICGSYVIIGEYSPRKWPNAMKITADQSRRICKEYPVLLKNSCLDYELIAQIFNGGQTTGDQHGI